eukprot:TRINITY_DN366_c0_g1_i4.p1 TRINITY_DN366_c0_g1~~TRINITY_DN366_c0_g1_i4.p1  ORF type:complete len:372 (+),score=123.83 TRINITY_DN366_c0_g1_i4:121-1236(+)
MGNCFSSDNMTAAEKKEFQEAKERNRKIELEAQQAMNEQRKVIKMLILGAGESGKSTLLKQMITHYGHGYKSVEERMRFLQDVFNFVIESMQTLVKSSDLLRDKIESKISSELVNEQKFFLEIPPDHRLTVDAQMAGLIERLWNDPCIQRCFELRQLFHLPDASRYFFERIREVSKPDYVPTFDDILRIRVRTTGVIQNNFLINESKFEVYDVGGQKSERKKWIHCFEGVTAVIFVAAISEYDQTMFEDNSQNRLLESIELFDSIANSKYFKNTNIILFLNKTDLFLEKINRVPLSVCFPDYNGPEHSAEDAKHFIHMQYQEKYKPFNGGNSNKELYTHFTTATDTSQMKHVLEAVQDMILRESLAKNGLL